MARQKYALPKVLERKCSSADYKKWLHRRAAAHVRRDRKRGNPDAVLSEYKEAIHAAVIRGGDRDAYTGERLDWSLINCYNNKKAHQGGREYKKKFAMMPTVDHVGDGRGKPNFKICSWLTNDSKSDLTLAELRRFCRKVLSYQS